MPQVSLYADDALMSILKERSSKEHISMSKYIAKLVKDQVMGKSDNWPSGYWDNVYGCWSEEEAHIAPAESCLNSQLDDTCDWFGEE